MHLLKLMRFLTKMFFLQIDLSVLDKVDYEEIIKHDYTAYDIFGRWSFEMDNVLLMRQNRSQQANH